MQDPDFPGNYDLTVNLVSETGSLLDMGQTEESLDIRCENALNDGDLTSLKIPVIAVGTVGQIRTDIYSPALLTTSRASPSCSKDRERGKHSNVDNRAVLDIQKNTRIPTSI